MNPVAFKPLHARSVVTDARSTGAAASPLAALLHDASFKALANLSLKGPIGPKERQASRVLVRELAMFQHAHPAEVSERASRVLAAIGIAQAVGHQRADVRAQGSAAAATFERFQAQEMVRAMFGAHTAPVRPFQPSSYAGRQSAMHSDPLFGARETEAEPPRWHQHRSRPMGSAFFAPGAHADPQEAPSEARGKASSRPNREPHAEPKARAQESYGERLRDKKWGPYGPSEAKNRKDAAPAAKVAKPPEAPPPRREVSALVVDHDVATLNIQAGTSYEDCRAQWKKTARATHPDHHPDDPEAEARFKDATSAWRNLEARFLVKAVNAGFEGLRDYLAQRKDGAKKA